MKAKITLLFILMTTIHMTSQVAFRHCALVVTSSNRTIIDHPAINNQPDLVLAVEKVRVEDKGTVYRNPYPISVGYDSAIGKHYLQNEDPSIPMPENTCYNVLAAPRDTTGNINGNFTHIATPASIPSGTPYQTLVDYSVMNDDAFIRCVWSRLFAGVYNDQTYDLAYNYLSPGQWLLLAAANLVVFPNAQFNFLCDLLLTSVIFEATSSSINTTNNVVSINDFEYFMTLDDPAINGDRDAIIFAQHRKEPATGIVLQEDSVFYDEATGKHEVHIELENYISGFIFPLSRIYDIFIIDTTLSVPENVVHNSIKVYPNPVEDIFIIETNQPISNVMIYNLLGQELKTLKGNGNSKLQIDVSNYASGQYIVKVQMRDTNKMIKMIKQ